MAKKQKEKTPKPIHATVRAKTDTLLGIDRLLETHETWLAWSIVSAYFIIMTFLTLRYHTTGGFGVETDFYAELAHQARLLLRGDFSVLNYGPKGPMYSFILAGAYLPVREYFTAGLLINLISSFVFLIALFYLVKRVFNRITAFAVILAVACNATFQSNTYQAGSDMPFMALSMLSMYFLFTRDTRTSLILSAVFGLCAFLTRYNGTFVATGTMLYLAFTGGSLTQRLKRMGIWLGVFILLGLPWFMPNTIVRGNPVYNSNYLNVAIEFYGIGQEGFSTETWYDELPDRFQSMGDVILHDPVHFSAHFISNIVTHFLLDIQKLIGIRLGIFIVLGGLLLFTLKPDRTMLLYFAFGVFYFMILALVFYNERFSMFLVAMYLPAATWPFTEKKLTRRLGRLWAVPVMVIFVLIASYGYTSALTTYRGIKPTPLMLDLKAVGKALDRIEPDKTQTLVARKPNTAHYAGLAPLMFPEDAKTVDQLVAYCREHNARYVLYSPVEYQFRPNLRILYNSEFTHPEVEMLTHGASSVIYRIKGL